MNCTMIGGPLIGSGELVRLCQGPVAKPQEIVVVSIDREATIKGLAKSAR